MAPLESLLALRGGKTEYEMEQSNREKEKRIINAKIIKRIRLMKKISDLSRIDNPERGIEWNGRLIELIVKDKENKICRYVCPIIEYEKNQNRECGVILRDGTWYRFYESLMFNDTDSTGQLSLVSEKNKNGERFPLISGSVDVPEISLRTRDRISVVHEEKNPEWLEIGDGRAICAILVSNTVKDSKELRKLRQGMNR